MRKNIYKLIVNRHLLVQNAGNKQTLYITCINIQFFGDEWQMNFGVRFDQLDQHLSSYVPQQNYTEKSVKISK